MSIINNLNVIIADDHPMMLEGLKTTLEDGNINILGIASEGLTALKLIIEHQPDLAILDIDMPYLTGLAIAEECQKRKLKSKIIILSFHKEAEFITQARNLNISGYLLKEDTRMVLFDCIQEVMNGKLYFSQSILQNNVSYSDETLNKLDSLTPSEKKILKLVALQNSSQQIAARLHISVRTVEKHRSNIISKLNIDIQNTSLSIWSINEKSLILNL